MFRVEIHFSAIRHNMTSMGRGAQNCQGNPTEEKANPSAQDLRQSHVERNNSPRLTQADLRETFKDKFHDMPERLNRLA